MNPDERRRFPEAAAARSAPTIKHIALAAGVSVATVSLALREHPKIPAATRARVISVAAKLGYRTNPLVATLMRQIRSGKPCRYQGSIAFLNLGIPGSQILYRSQYFQAIHRGAVDQASRHGYRLETFCIEDQHITGRRLTSVLRARDIRGILIPPLPDPKPLMEIDWSCFSSVALTHSLISPRMHRVCPNQFDNMTMLLDELKQSGYKRIGLYLDDMTDDRVNRFWTAAFLRYQQELSSRQRVPLLLAEKSNCTAFHKWRQRNGPDAVISPFGEVRHWLDAHGCRVPEDIGLAMPNSDPRHPDVSGIDECPEKIGADATDMVVLEISCNERGIPALPKTLSIRGKWKPGKTTRCI